MARHPPVFVDGPRCPLRRDVVQPTPGVFSVMEPFMVPCLPEAQLHLSCTDERRGRVGRRRKSTAALVRSLLCWWGRGGSNSRRAD